MAQTSPVLCLDELSLVGVDDATTKNLKTGLTELAAQQGVSLFFDATGACLHGFGSGAKLMAHARGRVTVLADRVRIVLLLLDERGAPKGKELVSHDKVLGFPSPKTEALLTRLLRIAGLTSRAKAQRTKPASEVVPGARDEVTAIALTPDKP